MLSNETVDDLPLLERNGPKSGITFTREQADCLIREQLNQTIKSFDYNDTGYNNLIFFIKINESNDEYVLKITGRYWIQVKTEIEVRALELLARFTTIPVPRVIAYSSDRNNQFGVEWILMTRLPGVNLDQICKERKLSIDGTKSIIRDLANFVAQMHFKIPRVNQIGTFRLDGTIGADLNGNGPWQTFDDFIRTRVRQEIPVLKNNEIFATVRESVLDAIGQFEKFTSISFENLPFVFSHGDLDTQNILVSMEDSDNPRITGIVDWEWSGSFPCSEEFFTSFRYFLKHENQDIHNYFMDQFEYYDILTPRTIENFSKLEKLDRFVTNLAPWDLTDLVNPDDPMAKQKMEQSHSIIKSAIRELIE